jgi:hypothetical protein
MIKILFSILCFLPFLVQAQNLPTMLAVPGGIVNIPLGKTDTAAPSVTFQAKKVLVLEQDKQWVAVVGIPLKIKVGQHSIQVKSAEKERKIDFSIADKDYPAQYITIKNKRMVNPNPDDLKRTRSERPAINK